ncbi:hypothetical protein Tco_0823679 [Tanacetum coccineum]|uniref:Uncharacterized protein n=1 Tax=Tanacetum coccineum TaxID=301880 RepID=A0ABQ5AIJ3_9ASTR
MDGDLDALVMDLQSRIIPDPLAVVRPDTTDNPQEMLLKGNERAVDLGDEVDRGQLQDTRNKLREIAKFEYLDSFGKVWGRPSGWDVIKLL